MKIDVIRTLADQVYICSIATSSFSEADQGLMSDFGTPDIDLGGTFGGTEALALGTVDISSGFNWDTDPQTFSVAVNGADPVEIALDADCDDLEEAIAHINAVFATVSMSSVVEAYPSSNYIGISTVHAGQDQELILTAGTYEEDVLATLGITPGTYAGVGAPDVELPARLRPINTLDTPMVQRFDARDERFVGGAEMDADLWISTIVTRIKAAVDTLRAERDTFSGETSETY